MLILQHSDQWVWSPVIGIAIMIVVGLDIFRYAKYGPDGTLTRLLRGYVWDSHPLISILIGMVIGGIIVHITGWY